MKCALLSVIHESTTYSTQTEQPPKNKVYLPASYSIQYLSSITRDDVIITVKGVNVLNTTVRRCTTRAFATSRPIYWTGGKVVGISQSLLLD